MGSAGTVTLGATELDGGDTFVLILEVRSFLCPLSDSFSAFLLPTLLSSYSPLSYLPTVYRFGASWAS